MKGDFSRNTFNAHHHFTRVLMQQGRVQLDADWNEQTSILLHYLRTLAADVIGDHGGPADGLGFEIKVPEDEDGVFAISEGHYYVDGLLCVSEKRPPYHGSMEDGSYLVYLDVWERHVTHLETRHPIREVALSGPDTATRAQLLCQVKLIPSYDNVDGEKVFVPESLSNEDNEDNEDDDDVKGARDFCSDWLADVKKRMMNRGSLAARLIGDNGDTDPCVIPPDSRYRGLENQLYRVEIHEGGKAGQATFKFSRENGSVVLPLAKPADGSKLFLEHLGRDDRFGLQKGDWVEIVDDDSVLKQRVHPLLKVESVDPVDRTVTLAQSPAASVGRDMTKHPILRRWDQKAGLEEEGGLTLKDGAATVVEGTLLELEDGIQIEFSGPEENGRAAVYKTGDYWLIPARTATGAIEWPRADPTDPESAGKALPPRGVTHHYAPLAIITVADGSVDENAIISCQKVFGAMAEHPSL